MRILPGPGACAALVAALVVVVGMTGPAPAQSRLDLPEGRAADALENAYELLQAGQFRAAFDAYQGVKARFAQRRIVSIAEHGSLVAAILQTTSIPLEQRDTLTRLRLIRTINDLRSAGVITQDEADYWQLFLEFNGNLTELARTQEFRFVDPAAFVAAVAASPSR